MTWLPRGSSGTPALHNSWLVPLLLPLLASLYLPLAVAGNLPGELVRLQDLVWPVGVTLIVGMLAWAMVIATSRDTEKAALAAVLVIATYSSLGAALKRMGYPGGDQHVELLAGLVLLYVVAIGGLILALLGTCRSLREVVRYLTLWGALLVIWNVGKVAWGQAHAGRRPNPPVSAEISAPATPPEPAPDIYLILLDKYTGSRMLDSAFGFDNRPFEAELRSRGFAVPTDAHANYIHTFLALGAMLNLRYLNDLTAQYGNRSEWELVYPLIENNRLAAFLRSRGYTIVTLPTAFSGTRENRYADLEIPDPRDVRSEIYARWVHTTAGPALRTLACHVVGCEENDPPYVPSSADVLDRQFQALADLPRDGKRALFVFAHLLVPHEPYMYGPKCEHRSPFWPLQDAAQIERVRRSYLDQIMCVNARLLPLVDTIRARSRVPPIILLQSDHGHGRMGRRPPALGAVAPDVVRERQSVFAAYLLPGVPADSISPRITPVNATRFVLRHYFQADLPALPDATFWSDARQPYIFERVQ